MSEMLLQGMGVCVALRACVCLLVQVYNTLAIRQPQRITRELSSGIQNTDIDTHVSYMHIHTYTIHSIPKIEQTINMRGVTQDTDTRHVPEYEK